MTKVSLVANPMERGSTRLNLSHDWSKLLLMKHVLVMVMGLAIVGCNSRTPAMSDNEFAEFRGAWPGMTGKCLDEVRYGGIQAWRPDDPACFEMMPAQRWSGLWNRGWEWTNFCPAPAKECPIEADRGDIWLTFAKNAHRGPEVSDGIYRIEFVGRRTRTPGPFGHLNQYDHLIVVDKMTSIRKVYEPAEDSGK